MVIYIAMLDCERGSGIVGSGGVIMGGSPASVTA